MKLIKFVAYLLYRYYRSGRDRNIAYFMTLLVLSMLTFIHGTQIVLAFRLYLYIPFFRSHGDATVFLRSLLLLIPIGIVYCLLIKESYLKSAEYDGSKIRRGKWLLGIYILLSVFLLIRVILKDAERDAEPTLITPARPSASHTPTCSPAPSPLIAGYRDGCPSHKDRYASPAVH